MSSATDHSRPVGPTTARAGGVSIDLITGLYRRHRIFVTLWVLIGIAAAAAVIFNLTPAFQATAEVALDSRVQRPDDYTSVVSGPFTLTDYAPIVRSETQVLESSALAMRVIDQLHLADVKEFQPGNGLRAHVTDFVTNLMLPLLPNSVKAFLFPPTVPDPVSQRTLMVENYLRRLSVSNDGRSLTIVVKFWADDPKLAAEIANAHVGLYVADQVRLKEATARQAMNRIGQQIERLGNDLRVKEDALRDFREEQGLVRAQGSTLIAQQAAQISDRLSQARVDLAQREAVVAQLRRHDAADADVQSPVLNSQLIQHLRQQESELNATLSKLKSAYHGNSPIVQTVQGQINGVHQQIAAETARIISSLRADTDIARARVASLSSQLKTLQTQLTGEDRSDVHVTAMERDITAQSAVYRDLLSRQQQIASQVGAEQADARIISPAMVPRLPFYPNKALFLVLAFVVLAATGLICAYLLDRMRKGVDRLEEIIPAGPVMHFHAIPWVASSQAKGQTLPDYLLDKPMGEFADGIRSLRGDIMHARLAPVTRVLAMTSTLPGEGKTTVALSMGRSMAAAGLHVLVIDCDLRRSRCASMLGIKPMKQGLLSALEGRCSLDSAVISDPRSSLMLLVPERRSVSPQDLLDSPMLQQLLDAAKSRYDFIILDTPPIVAVADALLVAQSADSVVLAVRWRSTSADLVAKSIRMFEERRLPLAGLFLNGVNIAESARSSGQSEIYKAIQAYYPSR